VRVDDSWPWHPKALQVGPIGQALFIASLAYCNKYLTDGYLSTSVIPSLVPLSEFPAGTLEATIERLIAARLWEPAPNGYKVHDYLDYQPSRETVLRQRAEAKERMRRVREAKKSPGDNRPETVREELERTLAEQREKQDKGMRGEELPHDTPESIADPADSPEVLKVKEHLAKAQQMLREERAKPSPDVRTIDTLNRLVEMDLNKLRSLSKDPQEFHDAAGADSGGAN